MDKPGMKGNGSRIDEEMKQAFGFVPEFFDALPASARADEWSVMRDFQLGESVLPQKMKELIGLAVAAHIKCRYCVYFHTQAARAFGATDEELKEACFMAGHTVQMSNALTGAMVDLERFKGEVDRAVVHMTRSSQGTAPQPSAHRH